MLNAFNYEIYTCNPETKETGWDIKFVDVFAVTKQEAKEILKRDVPDFDCIILFNYGMPINEEQLAYTRETGLAYRFETV